MWIFIGLAVGSAVYAFSMFSEYRVFVQDIQPQIAHLELKAEKIEKETDVEVKLQKEVAGRVAAAQQLITEQQHEMWTIEEKIRTAKQQQQMLEMEMHTEEFKRSKGA